MLILILVSIFRRFCASLILTSISLSAFQIVEALPLTINTEGLKTCESMWSIPWVNNYFSSPRSLIFDDSKASLGLDLRALPLWKVDSDK